MGSAAGTRDLNRMCWAGETSFFLSLPTVCLKQATSHLVAKGVMSLSPSPSPSVGSCDNTSVGSCVNGSHFGPEQQEIWRGQGCPMAELLRTLPGEERTTLFISSELLAALCCYPEHSQLGL